MSIVRRIGRVLHVILRFTLPPAIPVVCALIAAGGIAAEVYLHSSAFRTANGDYWEFRRRTGTEHPEKREEARLALLDYIEGPRYLPDGMRQRANYYLFQLLREEPDGDRALLDTTIDAILHPSPYPGSGSFAEAAIALTERGGLDAEARALVDEGFAYVKKYVDGRREDGRYEDDEEYQEALDRMNAGLYDARGWLYLQQGQMEEAELDLSRALENQPKNPLFLYHMGSLYERKLLACEVGNGGGDPEQLRAHAEDYYLRGMLAIWRYDWANPSVAALEAIYLENHESLEGFEEHFAEAIETHTRERREGVLARRLGEPKDMVAFELENLAGGTLSSETLAGKVAVINFWGTWCGPCVKELPELQLFHEKYKDHENVVVLTVSAHDDSQEEVREWMAERDYTYTALWDGGYNDLTDIRGYPTTWFLAPDGTIQYSVLGTTFRLLEEWSWMVEELLGSQEH